MNKQVIKNSSKKEFKRAIFDRGCIYYSSIKLSNKQSACIFFYKHPMENNYEIFYVGFAIGKNRKQIFNTFIGTNNGQGHYLKLRSSGMCGLEGLFWAKQQIIKFEKWIIKNSKHNIKIRVRGDDERRFRVYKYGLSKIGYKEHYNYLEKELVQC